MLITYVITTPFNLKKKLPKKTVFMPITNVLANHLQKVQNSAASLVLGMFSKEKDVIGSIECRELNLLKTLLD